MTNTQYIYPYSFRPEDIAFLKESNFFDRDWYAAQPNARDLGTRQHAVMHYVASGHVIKLSPNSEFNSIAYLAANPDLVAARVDPVLHYLRRGRYEGRRQALPSEIYNQIERELSGALESLSSPTPSAEHLRQTVAELRDIKLCLPLVGNALSRAASQSLEGALRALDRPIVVFAGGANPLSVDPREGYEQRVAAIDSHLSSRKRVYIKISPGRPPGASLRDLGPGCLELEVSGSGAGSDEAVLNGLLHRAQAVYCHSIYTLSSPQSRRLVGQRRAPLIVDMHGVVPEEEEIARGAEVASQMALIEAWAVLEAEVLVHVSRQMMRHFDQKYPWLRVKHIVCPIFAPRSHSDWGTTSKTNRVVYAGGTQPWQQIERIVDGVAAGIKKYRFGILSKDVSTFESLLREKGIATDPDRLFVKSVSPLELRQIYAESSYGILCREANIVNRVACPTKLVEYLQAGLLPVMGSLEVGDFEELGMQSVPIEFLSANALPEGKRLLEMVEKNYEVLRALEQLATCGLSEIAAQLEADRINW